MNEKAVEALLETLLEQFAARGIPRTSGDVQVYLRYRRGLIQQEQALFDELLRQGAFPGAAAETVEIAEGRLEPQSSYQQVDSEVEAVV